MSRSVDDFLADLDQYSGSSLTARVDSLLQQPHPPPTRTASTASHPPSQQAASTQSAVVPAQRRDGSDKDASRKRNRAADGEDAASRTGNGERMPIQAHSTATHLRPALVWNCAACTFENDASSARCGMCSTARSSAEEGMQVLCKRCGAMFPRCSQRPSCPSCLTAPEEVLSSIRNPMMLDDDTEGIAAPSAAGLAVDGMAEDGNEEQSGEYNEEDEEDDVSSEEFDEEQEVYSDASSEDEGHGDEGTESSQDRAADHGNASLTQHELRARDAQLVQFLAELRTAPHESLPEATCPESMYRSGGLLPFQLQGLSWLMQREGHDLYPPPGRSGSGGDGPHTSDGCPQPSQGAPPRSNFDAVDDGGLSSPAVKGVSYYGGGILADFMGLGKTRMMIALAEATRIRRADRLQFTRVASHATIVVCPMSLMSQWYREIITSVHPPRKVLKYYGAHRKAKSLFEIAQNYDFVLTSYQTLAREPPDGAEPPSKLRMIFWRRVILDEAHYIRNGASMQSRAATRTLDAKYRWAVTATPMQNRLSDLYPLMNFLRIPHFSDAAWWRSEIDAPLTTSRDNPRAIGALRHLFSSVMLRRLPTSLVRGVPILHLPPKTTTKETVMLSSSEREFYNALHENAEHRVHQANRGGDNLRAFSTAFEMLIRCRQCALHPNIVVLALLRKAEAQGLDWTALLPMKRVDEKGATQADLDRFLVAMRRKLARENAQFVNESLELVSNQQELKTKECIICLEVMSKPAMLPCAHMFCEECLRNALRVSTQGRCPLCKRPARQNEVVCVPEVTQQVQPSLTEQMERAVLEDQRQWQPSSKTTCILGKIQKTAEDEKVVVFSHFTTYLKYLAVALDAAQISSAFFTGEMSANKRDDVVQRFNRSQKPKVLLCSITACGVGINLTRANHCIIADPSWNPGVEEQAMNRIYRIGQTRPTTVTRLLCSDSVDVQIDALAEQKRELAELCVGGGRHGTSGRLNRQDLMQLFARPIATAPPQHSPAPPASQQPVA